MLLNIQEETPYVHTGECSTMIPKSFLHNR